MAIRAVLGGETVDFVPKLVEVRMLTVGAFQGVSGVFQVRDTGLGLPVQDQLVEFGRDGYVFGHQAVPLNYSWVKPTL